VGISWINQAYSGDKYPFCLRRAAIGILRIMIECRLPLDIRQLLDSAQARYPSSRINNFNVVNLRRKAVAKA